MHFDRNPFHVLMRRVQNGISDFRFGTLSSRFPSYGVASVAVKGLMSSSVTRLKASKGLFCLHTHGSSFLCAEIRVTDGTDQVCV